MITRIRITSGPDRKAPKAGDERFLKGRGVTQIRQQSRTWMRHCYGAWIYRNGKPVWEWVDKGSSKDRTAPGWHAPTL